MAIMKMYKIGILAVFFLQTAMFSCGNKDFPEIEDEETEQAEPIPEIPDDPGDDGDDELITNSQNVNYDNAVLVDFTSNGANITNPFEDKGLSIENNNGHIVIHSETIGKELNYILSGITDNGSVKIYSDENFGLILNGTGITNPNGSAINIQSSKSASITIIDETNNRLIDGASYTYTENEDMKGTFFSEGDLNFNGKGLIEIRGKNKHAICSDGAISVAECAISIKEAASDGVHANDGITMTSGDFSIRSTGDGIESESKNEAISITGGNLSIITTGEKGHGIKAKQDIEIGPDGNIAVSTYGVASKGIKPSGNITITGGEITVNTAGDAIWDDDDQDISSATGIKCDGDFIMQGGILTLLSAGKGGKGISADGTLTINDGTVSVTTTGDQFVYDSDNDTAAKAIKSDGNLVINGGKITIRTTKTEAEGLESKSTLTITGGEVNIDAYDDGINASNHIQFDGGKIFVKSNTNDAIDSNGTLTVTGGTIIAAGSSQPEGGFDCDNNRFTITGGTLIGIGGATSTPTANVSTQRSLIFGSNSKIQNIRIETSSEGKEVLTFKLTKTYSSGIILLFSSADLTGNTQFTIYTDGTIAGGSDFQGLYSGATYSKGTSAGTFTTGSSAGSVSTFGTTQNQGGGGFPGGGGRP